MIMRVTKPFSGDLITSLRFLSFSEHSPSEGELCNYLNNSHHHRVFYSVAEWLRGNAHWIGYNFIDFFFFFPTERSVQNALIPRKKHSSFFYFPNTAMSQNSMHICQYFLPGVWKC